MPTPLFYQHNKKQSIVAYQEMKYRPQLAIGTRDIAKKSSGTFLQVRRKLEHIFSGKILQWAKWRLVGVFARWPDSSTFRNAELRGWLRVPVPGVCDNVFTLDLVREKTCQNLGGKHVMILKMVCWQLDKLLKKKKSEGWNKHKIRETEIIYWETIVLGEMWCLNADLYYVFKKKSVLCVWMWP